MIVLFVSLFGYTIGGALVIFAGLKVLSPRTTGLWKMTYPNGQWGLSFQFGNNVPSGKELLGWWTLPICLVVGSILLFITFRFGNWCLRKFWRPRFLQTA